MEVLRKTLYQKRNVTSVDHVSNRFVFNSVVPSKSSVLTLCDLSKLNSASDASGSHVIELTDINGYRVGPMSTLDPSGNCIFTTLENSSRIAVFSFDDVSSSSLPAVSETDPQFESPIHSLDVIGTPSQYTVMAVSRAGEIAMVHNGSEGEACHRVLDRLSVHSVLSTCTFKDDHLIVFANQHNSLVLYALQISLKDNLESTKVKVFGPTSLPVPSAAPSLSENPDRTALLATHFESNFVVMLFIDGTVNIVAPPLSAIRDFPESLKAWFPPASSEANPDRPVSAIHTMTLAGRPSTYQGDPANTMATDDAPCTGDVTGFGKHYLAVAYGECLSLWDTAYFSAQGYAHLSRPVHRVCTSKPAASLTVADSVGVHILTFLDNDHSKPPSLAKTIQLKKSCNAIISKVHPVVERTPKHGHSIASAPVTAAAHAGGDVSHIFERTLRAERKRELREFRGVLSSETTLDSQGMYKLAHLYIRRRPKERVSGSKLANVGQISSSNMPQIPSDRFASAFVARCLYEIAKKGKFSFAFPLIDMIETGIVSAAGVLNALDVWCSLVRDDDRNKRINISSIAAMVIESGNFFNVLEALVSHVADLPEEDMIHIVQFAARHYSKGSLQSIGDKGSSNSETNLSTARAARLLQTCFSVGVDKEQILRSFAMVPFDDIIALLVSFKQYLSNSIDCDTKFSSSTDEVLKKQAYKAERAIRNGTPRDRQSALDYRGVEAWLDSDFMEAGRRVKSDMEGCLDWIGYILDAQFFNLVIDDKGQKLASELLLVVRSERKKRDSLDSLTGIAWHLQEGRKLPNHQSPFYRVHEVLLPIGSTLQ